MSRVTTPIKVGERVFWEDNDSLSDTRVILSGRVSGIGGRVGSARIIDLRIHSLISDTGSNAQQINSLAKILSIAVDVAWSDLKRMEDAKWVIS